MAVPQQTSQRAEYERLCKEAVKEFRWRFDNQSPTVGVYAPGRVNLIGEHTDYNGGFVLPMALHLVTVILGRPSPSGSRNCRLITAASTGETGYHEFPVPQFPKDEPWEVETEGPFWATYLKGVVALMNRSGSIPPFDAIIATSVPLGGGLSSSAALEAATCRFIESERSTDMPRVRCGIMDQFVSLMGSEKNALFIDCRSHEVQQVPMKEPELVVLIANSNYRHSLGEGVDKEYEKRRQTCEAVAKKLGRDMLRDLTLEDLEGHWEGCSGASGVLPSRHVVTEIQRTSDAVRALTDGDYLKFGQLMTASHKSLRDDYEVSCGELDKLVNLALDGEGVLGSRMTGGGFGGCTVTLLKRSAMQSTIARIQESYESRNGEKATFYIATPCGGAGDIPQKLVVGKKGRGVTVDIGKKKKEMNEVDYIPEGIDSKTMIRIGNEEPFECKAEDLIEEKELGRGAYGSVYQMRHSKTDTIMAVKRIRATIDSNERRRLLMDLRVSMRCLDCPYTVTFFGALFKDGDVWICMELMDMSLHDLYKLVYEKLHLTIPEWGRWENGRSYVKPSNILINRAGQVKLCDFGIAGELVNSFCQTDIGCKPYLAPERINPMVLGAKYDQRSDVWSYGITLYELAVGQFPYPVWKNMFEQLKSVVDGEAPRVPANLSLSPEFTDYLHLCLTKDVETRPGFQELLNHAFIRMMEEEVREVKTWYADIVARNKQLPDL
ncbi:Galactokinase [Geodia barretti]|uniref:mitogen-activated protein kinase kinase n=1 Tax=Geodia barretti TaxID=519541 RepID=A0AA35TUR0_GEOBA|nr:Galactokinase [Geodia barretti]